MSTKLRFRPTVQPLEVRCMVAGDTGLGVVDEALEDPARSEFCSAT